jgi:alcohol dehydrogenase class IV
MFAGMAFSNTQTAISHAIYFIINKNVSHGIACSFLLPQIIDSLIWKYDFIDEAFIEIFGELSSDKLKKMLLSLHVKTKITDYGVNEKELNNIKQGINNSPRSANSLISVDDIKFDI